MLHDFDEGTQEAIRKSLPENLLVQVDAGAFTPTTGSSGRHWAPEPDAVGTPGRASTATLPRKGGEG